MAQRHDLHENAAPSEGQIKALAARVPSHRFLF
jgi:hypothetical protein